MDLDQLNRLSQIYWRLTAPAARSYTFERAVERLQERIAEEVEKVLDKPVPSAQHSIAKNVMDDEIPF